MRPAQIPDIPDRRGLRPPSALWVSASIALAGALVYTSIRGDALDASSGHFVYAALTMGCWGGWLVWMVWRDPANVNAAHILACLLAIGFSIRGVLPSGDAYWITASDDSIYVLTIVTCQIGIAALVIGFGPSSRRGRENSIATLVERLCRAPGLPIALFICLGLEFAAYAFLQASGQFLSHLGASTTTRESTGVLVITMPFLRTMGIVLSSCAWLSDSPANRRIGGIALIIQIALAFLQGRSTLLISLLIPIGMLLLSQRRADLSRRKVAFYSTVLIAVVVFVCWPLYQSIRVNALREGDLWAQGLQLEWLVTSAIPDAVRDFSLAQAYRPESEYLANVAARVGLADFVAEILEAQSRGTAWLNGEAGMVALLLAIPRLLWPGKPEMSEEALVVDHYGLPPFDHTTSLLGFGLADFGILGVALYYLAVGLIMRLLSSQAARTNSLVMLIGLVAILTSLMFSVEGDISAYTTTLRFWPIVAAVSWALSLWYAPLNTFRPRT